MLDHPTLDRGLFGREIEMGQLQQCLDDMTAGSGSTILISGEAGIGKTRLIEELISIASNENMDILSGSASEDSLIPFQIFSKALGDDSSLFQDQEYTKFTEIFAVDSAGLLVGQASSGEGDMDADIFAGMLSAVQGFIRDSFVNAGNKRSGLGRLEYGDMTILIEHGEHLFLTAVFKGSEHNDMRTSLKICLEIVEADDQIFKDWSGSMGEMKQVQDEITLLAESKFMVRRDIENINLDDERIRIADEVLASLQARTQEKPLLLILEDLHWADESSLFVLNYLARNVGLENILIVGTSRPAEGEAFEAKLKIMKEEGTISELALDRLGSDGITSIMNDLYPENSFPSTFYEDLSSQCEGNPLFVKEILWHMEEEGDISESNGTYVLERVSINIPSSVEGVVHQRLQSLDLDAMTLAEYASCMGKEFNCDVVCSLPSIVDPRMALSNLESSGIIVIDKENAEFTHAIFHNVTYNSMTDRWKMAYHKSIGEYYESAYKSRVDDVLYDLARHFANSNEHRKALDYCIKAGEKAESTFAPEQAIEFYRKALAISTMRNYTPSINLQERLGDLYSVTGDFDDSIGIYRAVSEASDDVSHRANVHRKIADVFEKKSEFDSGKDECNIGLSLLPDNISIEKTKLYTTLGNIEMRKGDYDEAKSILKKSLDIADKLKNKWELGRIYHILGSTLLYQGDYDGALNNLQKALDHRREVNDISGESATVNNIGNVYARKGEYKEALEYYEIAIEVAKKLGNKMGEANTLANIGSVYLGRGEADNAIPYLEQSVSIEKQIGDMRGAAISLVNMNVAYYIKEEFERAIEITTEAKDICLKYDFKYIIIYCYNGLCELNLKSGKLDNALENAKLALEVSQEIKTKDGMGMSYLNLGTAYMAQDDLDTSEENLQMSREIMEELEHNQLSDLYYNFGLLWKKKGDKSQSIEFLNMSKEKYEKMGDQINIDKVQKELDELEK